MGQFKIFEAENQDYTKVGLLPQKIKGVSLLLLMLLSGVILMAAYGKMFFPSEDLYLLDFSVSLFEIGFLVFLILYRNRIEMWLIASMVFSCWGGYALFWYLVELPCSCMGAYITIPDGFSLSMDALFYVISLCMAFVLGARKQLMLLSLLNAVLFTAGGFAFAKWIYATALID